jgi:dTDP-4-dehydrorhamnose reductase
MKLLLLGPNGQVGWELQRALAPLGEVVCWARGQADFSKADALSAAVRQCRPDVIVNAAAHTAVDKAEQEPALAQAINATAPAVLAREATALGAWLVHYSTDYVFDGRGDAPRDETAPLGPLSVYGRTKAEGEEAIRASGCRHLLFRTSWVYSARGGNFARTMLGLAQTRPVLKVVADQIGAPTGADLLADTTAHALRMARADATLAGTYHLVAAGHTSWHGYASHVFDWARRHGLPLALAPDGVVPVPSHEFPVAAQRPLNSRLSTAKLQQRFGLTLPPWQQGVDRMLAEAHPNARIEQEPSR